MKWPWTVAVGRIGQFWVFNLTCICKLEDVWRFGGLARIQILGVSILHLLVLVVLEVCPSGFLEVRVLLSECSDLNAFLLRSHPDLSLSFLCDLKDDFYSRIIGHRKQSSDVPYIVLLSLPCLHPSDICCSNTWRRRRTRKYACRR